MCFGLPLGMRGDPGACGPAISTLRDVWSFRPAPGNAPVSLVDFPELFLGKRSGLVGFRMVAIRVPFLDKRPISLPDFRGLRAGFKPEQAEIGF